LLTGYFEPIVQGSRLPNPEFHVPLYLTTKLIHSMRRDGLTRGLVTLCIGGGQGIALAIEAVH